MEAQLTKQDHLIAPDPATIKQEMHLQEPTEIHAEPGESLKLEEEADRVAERLMALDPADFETATANKVAVEKMGLKVQQAAAQRSQMLKQPIAKLSKRGEDGGEVANALVDLKIQVEELDPINFDFTPGWFSRLLGFLPFIGKPIKRYFSRYESAQTVLAAISDSLKKGQKQLERDNITLVDDQRMMQELTKQLEESIKLGQLIDAKLEGRLERELQAGDAKYKFIQEEILFPLRQRIQDLQQQMIVNQQGFMAIEMIIRNNKELIRGVDRALTVTMSALQVAVTLALALANQRIVLDKIKAVNETTNALIAGTAQRLKEQGAEIHKQAAGTQLDIEVLKQAFADVRAALDDISRFRQESLPKMAQSILELDKMSEAQSEAIQRLEEGNQVADALEIEVVD